LLTLGCEIDDANAQAKYETACSSQAAQVAERDTEKINVQ